jgi:(S)-sulfolactate dehydrogenase
MKILLPEAMHAQSLQRLRAAHTVVYEPTLFTRPAELLQAAPEADALIVRNRSQVRGALLDALTRCRVIGRLGVGLDNIDVETCRARGITVVPALGANARSVAEYVLTCAMLLLRRSHYTVSAEVAAGHWPRPAVPEGLEIAGRTLGIVGFGSIGQLTARLASRLDMQIVAHDPAPTAEQHAALAGLAGRWLPLDELLACSDVVSLHMPLVAATRGLFGGERFAAMRAGAVFINAARGGIVDEAALAAALHRGHLRGAALDVFGEEPLPAGSALVGAPNLLLSPHVAGVTADAELRVCELVADRVLALLAQPAP